MRYPFTTMAIGETKRKQFTDKRLAKNAQLAAYKIQARQNKRFTIHMEGCLVTVKRLPDRTDPNKKDFVDVIFDRRNPDNPMHGLRRNEVLRIEFARLHELNEFGAKAENIANVQGWQLSIKREGMKLIIERLDIPQYRRGNIKGEAKKKCKYPFNAMLKGDYIYLTCSTLQQREKARQAAYVMACLKGWKFETKAVLGNNNLKIWRLK